MNELKIEELLSMGVAHDRGQAISALQDCRWDLNAAAAALISWCITFLIDVVDFIKDVYKSFRTDFKSFLY